MTANADSTYKLGNKIQYFRPDWINIIPHFLVTEFFAVFISFICFLPILILTSNAPRSTQELYGIALFLMLGSITVFIGITSIVRVSLYQHGLVYKCAWWTKAIHYRDIGDISYKITSYQSYGQTIGNAYVYKLRIKNDRQITLDGRIHKIAELGRTIEHEIVDRCLPEVLSKFQAGEAINFGAWKISTNGIKVGNKSIYWENFGKVEIEDGTISIYQSNNNWLPWHKTPIERVPNLKIFLELIERKIAENNRMFS